MLPQRQLAVDHEIDRLTAGAVDRGPGAGLEVDHELNQFGLSGSIRYVKSRFGEDLASTRRLTQHIRAGGGDRDDTERHAGYWNDCSLHGIVHSTFSQQSRSSG